MNLVPHRSAALYDSATFWALLGGAMVVFGGTSTSIGVAQTLALRSPNYFLSGWFISGVVVLALAVFVLLWALALYLAHGHRARHDVVVNPVGPPAPSAAPEPRAPSARRQAQEETVDKMLGHSSSMISAARYNADQITAPRILSGITGIEVGRLNDCPEGRAVVAAHDRCVQLYNARDGMGVWMVDTDALSQAAAELEDAADRWRAVHV
jgi:hypothetical protein